MQPISLTQTDRLSSLLERTFGYQSFWPLQRDIIESSLSGRDVFALLPTGGGKSLCYQLPALMREGLTLVVSPLIALMKDQVDAMESAGVPATFLNSSLDAQEAERRLSGLDQNQYKLLYVAPERLMLPGFIENLIRWNIELIAIDEAHCISEWGHDFRPEYRRIAELRDILPKAPMLALTATATARVREDILNQLRLRDPHQYVASFNRPNLTYRVLPKRGAYDRILDYIKNHPTDSGIIYCHSRKSTESIAQQLRNDGISAKAYHAGLNPRERIRNQDMFLRDDARVICATVAFGMGINKSNVRFVIHHDLPKNVEGYYQETGRAGRDGLPAECTLYFNPGDAVKYARFIEEKDDPNEREIARTQLRQIVHYAESAACRRAALLQYFGEELLGGNCGACDNCLSPRATYDGSLSAQLFVSCVYSIKEMSGFSVGVTHVVEVLTGADTAKVRRWRHETLSTYGTGKDHSRPEWAEIGRQLIRMGLVNQLNEQFGVLELTAEGFAVMAGEKSVQLTQPVVQPKLSAKSGGSNKVRRAGEIDCDEELFENLRRLRKQLADSRNVPAYIVFSDASIKQMARDMPSNESEFKQITGVGDKKLRVFGKIFLKEIAAFNGSSTHS